MHHCLQHKAPEYLVDCCTPVSDILSRRHLRSATRHHLTVPRYRLSTFGRRAFYVAGPTVRNSLPDSLRDSALTSNSFRQSLMKTNLILTLLLSTHSVVEMPHNSALYKSIIDNDIDILTLTQLKQQKNQQVLDITLAAHHHRRKCAQCVHLYQI